MVEFCPKCGTLLKVKSEGGEKRLFCKKCETITSLSNNSASIKSATEIKIKKNIKRKNIQRTAKFKTIILSDKSEDKLGLIKQLCPICGNTTAYMFEMPPLWGDEENLIRYKCSKCNHVWSEGSVVSGR